MDPNFPHFPKFGNYPSLPTNRNSQTNFQNFQFDPAFTSHPQFQMFKQMMENNPNTHPSFNQYSSTSHERFNPESYPNFPVFPSSQPSQRFPPSPNIEARASAASANEGNEGEENDDLIETNPRSFSQAASPKGKKNWSTAEDEALIAAFMEHTTDAVIGTNQKYSQLWRKVMESYRSAQMENPHQINPRTGPMMRARWKRMATAVMKWIGCYEEAVRFRGSGFNEEDVLRQARIIYEHNEGGTSFVFEHAWNMLKKYPKWQTVLINSLPQAGKAREAPPNTEDSEGSCGSGKRMRLDESGTFSNPDTPNSGEGLDSCRRPEGVKAARKKKGKGVAGASKDVLMNWGESIKFYSETKAVDLDLQRERLEYQRRKEARKEKQMQLEERQLQMQETKMKWEMLQALLGKTLLTPSEEALKEKLLQDLSNFSF